MKKPIISALIVVLLLFTITACGKTTSPSATPPKKTDITVAFIPKLRGNSFFEAANAGAQKHAQKHGYRVKYAGSTKADVQEQIKIVRNNIAAKVDAICISALDPKELSPILKEAMAKGIKVVTWDSDVSPDARSIMISQGTADQLSKMLVEMGAKSLLARGKDPRKETVRYVWHYSQSVVTDQNSWQIAGERYIRATYPSWENVRQENYYSEQNPGKAISVGEEILKTHPDIDLIICNDSTALPGQAQALKNLGRTAKNLTVTGFAPPNVMRGYCKDGIIERWGLWDCQVQGALGSYLAYYLATGNKATVGSKIDVADIGTITVMPNTVLNAASYTSPDSGIVLLPERLEFTINNVDNYNF